jgi:uncharacterized protein YjbI with pentapeptide repeats
MINEALNLEVWDRLIQGKPLDGLTLTTKENRIDLGGLELPEPLILRRFQVRGVAMAEIDPGAVIHGAKLRNLDFTGSKLNGLRLFECELKNCRFDRCQLQDLRAWKTTFSEISFKGANLRSSALGGVQNGQRNIFSGVDFSGADLRETVYKAAAFERCIFRDSKLVNVDFQTSTFTDCVFEGDLRGVLFYRRGFEGEAFPPNEMINVDLSRAKLHDVSFRGLMLDRVKLPDDAEHIVIRNVPITLDKLIAVLKQQGDALGKQLVAFLNIDRKWVVPNQAQAVINVQDLEDALGDAGVKRLRELLEQ